MTLLHHQTAVRDSGTLVPWTSAWTDTQTGEMSIKGDLGLTTEEGGSLVNLG